MKRQEDNEEWDTCNVMAMRKRHCRTRRIKSIAKMEHLNFMCTLICSGILLLAVIFRWPLSNWMRMRFRTDVGFFHRTSPSASLPVLALSIFSFFVFFFGLGFLFFIALEVELLVMGCEPTDWFTIQCVAKFITYKWCGLIPRIYRSHNSLQHFK